MDLRLNIQDSAWKVGKQLRQGDHAGQHLRVYLSGKGCDGFEYGVSFDNPDKDDYVVESSNATAKKLDGQAPSELCFLVDTETAEFVNNSEIEWVDDERGKGFLIDNPKHKRFRGKFFRDKNWKKKIFGKDAENVEQEAGSPE